MPICCNSMHVGWVCPRCGIPMKIKTHSGNEPVTIGKISPPELKQQVTVVQGDYIQGSVIKDSVVMGDVPKQEQKENISVEGNTIRENISEDSIIANKPELND